MSEQVITSAPQPAPAPDAELAEFLDLCGPGDAALHRAAARLLSPELEKLELDTHGLVFALRTSGSPYVRVRGLRTTLPKRNVKLVESEVKRWLASEPATGQRCGVARSATGTRLALVAAQATAQLAALPTEVARGSQIRFRALLQQPAPFAQLVVLDPAGTSREITTRFSGERVDALFYVDTPGTHRVQLMVDAEGGPQTALEAWVAVEQPLPELPPNPEAPGEQASVAGRSPEENLTAMLNAARRASGVAALVRSRALDQLARHHAVAMQREGQLAHDLGRGNPLWRVQAAGIIAKTTGENLARAPSIERAHRAIWKSPSHRANLLAAHFDTVGIGVSQDSSGQLWVCQLLTDEF